MSVLQTLRERAGALVAGVIGVSLLIFVVSDFFNSNTSQRRRANKYYEMAVVDGETVSYQDYETKIQELTEIYKMSGTSEISEQIANNIREQVWQQMLSDKLLSKTYRQTGLSVSPDEVEMLVFGDNPHPVVRQLFTNPQTGMLDKSYMVNVLKNMQEDDAYRNYWLFFEDQIINDRLNSKLINLISKGICVTDQQSEFEANLLRQTVNFSFTGRNYSSIPDSTVKVSSEEIKEYYKKHTENYKRSPQRDMEYIVFDIKPSEADYQETKAWVEKEKEHFAEATDVADFINLSADTRHTGFYKTMSELPDSLKELAADGDKSKVYGPYFEDDTYKMARIIDIADRPDSVWVAHILIAAGQVRSFAQARVEADSLYKLLKNGTDFNTLAMASSDDQQSAQVGGDLGWFSEGMMILPFNNACFQNNKGDLLKVETSIGVHIVKILGQSRKVRKYDIGVIDRKVIASNTTTQDIYSRALQFAGTNNTYEKFNKAVSEGNLDKKLALAVTPDQKELPGLPQARSLVISLFQNGETGSIILDNNHQAVFEMDDKYVVGYCSRVQEEGYSPVEDVASDIRFILAKKKKGEILSEEMSKLAAEGKTIYEIASEYNTTVQDASGISYRSYSVPGAGVEPALIAAASAGQAGVLSKPVQGNNSVYIFVVNSVTPAEAEDVELINKRLQSNYQIRASYEAYEAIKDKKEIVDHRYKFY